MTYNGYPMMNQNNAILHYNQRFGGGNMNNHYNKNGQFRQNMKPQNNAAPISFNQNRESQTQAANKQKTSLKLSDANKSYIPKARRENNNQDMKPSNNNDLDLNLGASIYMPQNVDLKKKEEEIQNKNRKIENNLTSNESKNEKKEENEIEKGEKNEIKKEEKKEQENEEKKEVKKEEKKEEKPNKIVNKPSGDFASKLGQMKKMFENKGFKPRPSAQFTGFRGLNSVGNIGNTNNNQKLDIITEKPDVMKEGYNPVNELEKNLDKIVIKKDKKKGKKPTFEE
jgi:hypothetical protein